MKRTAVGVILVGVIAWGAVTAALVLLSGDTSEPVPGPTAAAEPGDGEQDSAEDVRTLLVSTSGEETISAPREALRASLIEGEIGVGPMTATVLSDENCAPHAEGISHCRNELRLSDGSALTVRHNHDMAEVPCLAPGERIMVVPA